MRLVCIQSNFQHFRFPEIQATTQKQISTYWLLIKSRNSKIFFHKFSWNQLLSSYSAVSRNTILYNDLQFNLLLRPFKNVGVITNIIPIIEKFIFYYFIL